MAKLQTHERQKKKYVGETFFSFSRSSDTFVLSYQRYYTAIYLSLVLV